MIESFKKEAKIHEINNLIFLQGKVSCPKYISHYYENGKLMLEMEKINGEKLFKIINKLNEYESHIIANNIIKELKKLRSLNITINYIVEDALLGILNFKDENELNDIIISNIKDVNLKSLCAKLLPTNSKFVLSHGDLHLSNILVRQDLSIVIIDWENLNYLPEYWDPMKFFTLFHSNSKIPTYILNELNSNLIAILCHEELVRRKF